MDHLCAELDSQFSEHSKLAVKLLNMVPSVLRTKVVKFSDIKELCKFYESDLHKTGVVEQEFSGWKWKWQSSEAEHTPQNCADTLKVCNESQYPNMFILLKITCVIPVTSCICERSFSALRRLDNYMRSSITQEHFTSLALMHIHYDTQIDTNHVIDLFCKKHIRWIMFQSVLIWSDFSNCSVTGICCTYVVKQTFLYDSYEFVSVSQKQACV